MGVRVGLVVLLLTGVLSLYQERPPAVVPDGALPAEFSAARAMGHVRAVAHKPHPIGSVAHKEVRNYILNELRAAGLTPEVQTTTALNNPGGDSPAFSATVHNIVAKLPGQRPGQGIALTCHYDSTPNSLGASDDGAGVATLIETLRALKAGPPLKNDILFLFTDAEEVGLLGAIGFVQEHPLAKEIKIFLNFEARGTSGPSLMFETSDGNGWLIRQIAQAAPQMVTNSLFYQIYRALPNSSDLTIFKRSGSLGLNFAYAKGAVNYHTMNDSVERINWRSLQHHGMYALALARQFGDRELPAERADDVIFFSVLGLILVYYPASWAIPLLALITILFLAFIILAIRRKRSTFGAMLGGASVVFAACLGATIATFIAWQAAQFLHPQYRSHRLGDVYNSHWYYLCFTFLALALATLIVAVTHRRIGMRGLAFGALIWWWLLLVLTSVLLPGASYLFAWPLLFALAGNAILLLTDETELNKWRVLSALLLGLLPAVVLWTPVIELLFVALTLLLAPAVMIPLVLALALLLSFAPPEGWRRKWALPGLSAGAATVFFLLGSLTAAQSKEQPTANTVLYCLNGDANQALWASIDAQTDVWTSQFFHTPPERGGLPECMPQSEIQFLRAPAPVAKMAAPKAELLADEKTGEVRTSRWRLTSPRNATGLAIFLEQGTDVLEAFVNGKAVPQESVKTEATKPRRWALYHNGLPPEGIELTLKTKVAQILRFKLVDRTYELPPPAEAPWTPRPDYFIPSIYFFCDSTLVAKTYSF
jgi:hypothetical protein